MTSLLEQFLSEARDALQGIGESLMRLERDPADAEQMTVLFRLVHTLKGNSGLFDVPEMTRVLHAGEDLMDAVRSGRLAFSQSVADVLLDATDVVSLLCEELEADRPGSAHAERSAVLASTLRSLIPVTSSANAPASGAAAQSMTAIESMALGALPPEAQPIARRHSNGVLHWVRYTPAEDCFFHGLDPFFQALGTPGHLWGRVCGPQTWPELSQLDPFRCKLAFEVLSDAAKAELEEYFRYVRAHVQLLPVQAPSPAEDLETLRDLLDIQRAILALPVEAPWHHGRLLAAANTIVACWRGPGRRDTLPALNEAVAKACAAGSGTPLLAWLDAHASPPAPAVAPTRPPAAAEADATVERRADDVVVPKSLKVDQAKIDRLMNLIGEMVVAKNSLPYLAGRAENVFGSRELSREIKAQYAVINRIAEEMQDAIMQVRMTPVSFVFQRFPRLVRDLTRKLGKEVQLKLSGEDTEADKNIIEALADPLMHIVRNSLDHGFELPEVRRAAGKPATGTLTIAAHQEADRVVIEIADDGKGIDPAVVKRKAYEKGLIDEAVLQHLSDQEAVNLVFAPGFSTTDVVSELSGRGVGMDVVKMAVEKVNGTVVLDSTVGKGTRLRLALPLSMAVTNVMVIESAGQMFGVPMDHVLETVRVRRSATHGIKDSLVTVLRGKVVPLKSINTLLGLDTPPRLNDDDEFAVLIVRVGDEAVGLLVDDVHETLDIILKPLAGVLGGISAYAGSALLGDGSVLLVLNARELLQ